MNDGRSVMSGILGGNESVLILPLLAVGDAGLRPDALSAGEGGAGAWRLVPWTWRQGRTTAMWAARARRHRSGGGAVISGGMKVY